MSAKAYLLAGVAACSAVAFSAAPAAAGAFYIQEQSVKGLGRAYSGEGADVGAASLWWNPAAIAGITGRGEFYGGLHTILVDGSVNDLGSTITRPGQPTTGVGGYDRQGKPVQTGLVPNLAGAYRLTDRLVLGLAVTAPYNFTSKYGADTFVRYEAIKSRLLTLDIQPTLAYRVTDWLDVGVGFDAEYTDATLTSALPNLSPLLPDGASSLKGDGWNYGYNVGVQLRPVSDWTFGLSYRSAIDHKLDGTVAITALQGTPYAQNVNASGTAKFSTPWIATFSGRWQATPRLTLNAQVQRIGWSEFKAINVEYTGGSQFSPQNYKDVTNAAIGAEYAFNDRFTLRGGVQYDPTPTPDVGRTARVPDGDRWLFGTGVTFMPRPNIAVDLSGAYIHFDKSQLNSSFVDYAGTPLATPVSLIGGISGEGAVLSAGMRYSF